MVVRVAQISDSHLSAEKPFFEANFEAVCTELEARAPDLVINTGDLSLDGADNDADLSHALALHKPISAPLYLLPGNHDVGDNQPNAKHQPIDATRLARWRRLIGPDHWLIDLPGWRLIGLNSILLDADLPERETQDAFLEAAVGDAGDRALALFLHKPLFVETAGDSDITSRAVNPAPRARLIAAFGPALKLVACGHIHQYRHSETVGQRHLWAPATSFIVPSYFQPSFGARIVGFLMHAFHPDGRHEFELVEPETLVCHDIDTIPGAYGDLRLAAAAGHSA